MEDAALRQICVKASMRKPCSISDWAPLAPASHEDMGSKPLCMAEASLKMCSREASEECELPHRRRVAASVKVLPRFW